MDVSPPFLKAFNWLEFCGVPQGTQQSISRCRKLKTSQHLYLRAQSPALLPVK